MQKREQEDEQEDEKKDKLMEACLSTKYQSVRKGTREQPNWLARELAAASSVR